MGVKKASHSVKLRVFLRLLLMLALVFFGVFFALNLFLNRYIQGNVQAQLEDLVRSNGQPDRGDGWRKDNAPADLVLPDLTGQKKNKIGAHGEVFIVNEAYQVQEFNQMNPRENSQELALIAEKMQSKGVSLTEARNESITTSTGQYYISTLANAKQPGGYLVFYINVSGINGLVAAVNWSLSALVVLALGICFAIANWVASSVTKPVKQLAGFAEEIGKGNFQQQSFDFKDTEFCELAEAMNQSAEKLDQYDNEQRAFFQNVSHELRTPLMSIRCYAEGVQCGLMNPQKSGGTIIAETDRLSELVEDLLYISRVDNLTNHLEKQENDLRDTFALCAGALQSLAEQRGLQIVYDFPQEPVLFCYNEKHMYRAFSNLISNALRYAKTQVVLHCHRDAQGIILSVTDDGPGVAQQDLPHIFERFYKGKDGKHGIGLSIVKSVVELHGGSVGVDCGSGTRFSILFAQK